MQDILSRSTPEWYVFETLSYTLLLTTMQIATTKEFPDLFPYQLDMNAGDTVGVGEFDGTASFDKYCIDWVT